MENNILLFCLMTSIDHQNNMSSSTNAHYLAGSLPPEEQLIQCRRTQPLSLNAAFTSTESSATEKVKNLTKALKQKLSNRRDKQKKKLNK